MAKMDREVNSEGLKVETKSEEKKELVLSLEEQQKLCRVEFNDGKVVSRVKLKAHVDANQPGDVCGFLEDKALELVRSGLAVFDVRKK